MQKGALARDTLQWIAPEMVAARTTTLLIEAGVYTFSVMLWKVRFAPQAVAGRAGATSAAALRLTSQPVKCTATTAADVRIHVPLIRGAVASTSAAARGVVVTSRLCRSLQKTAGTRIHATGLYARAG
ncbi:hypothetical protein HK405_001135, partial [Cladochytrium tenue]